MAEFSTDAEIVRRFYAVANRLAQGGDLTTEDESLLTPDFRAIAPGMPPMDQEAFLAFSRDFAAAFPGYTIDIDELVADGGRVATRVTWRGTHRGDFQGIAPTGRNFEILGMHIDQLRDGRIAEHWGMFDTVGLLQQLGILPAP